MDALKALQSRVSSARLVEPGPTKKALESIKKAALRAADHGRLRPWRFLVIEGEGREKLGDLFVVAEKHRTMDLNEKVSQIIFKKAMRAPTIIVVVACIKQHPRVPEIEQLISAGAAAQNMLNAAYALDLGAIWRTGDIAYDSTFSKKLGLDANEKIVGFLYLGTAPDGLRTKTPQLNTTDFFKSWP